MDKIATVDLELGNNPEIFTKLKEFVNVCFENKKFSFKADEFFPEEILIVNEILTLEDNKVKILNYYAFSIAFFDVCKENLKFDFSSDFLSTLNFLSEISKDFKRSILNSSIQEIIIKPKIPARRKILRALSSGTLSKI